MLFSTMLLEEDEENNRIRNRKVYMRDCTSQDGDSRAGHSAFKTQSIAPFAHQTTHLLLSLSENEQCPLSLKAPFRKISTLIFGLRFLSLFPW